MTIFCHTCRRSFAAGPNEIVYDNGSDLAVFKCPTCQARYLAVADERFKVPLLLKLTATKSYVIDKEESNIMKPPERGLIVTPEQAMAEARQRLSSRRSE